MNPYCRVIRSNHHSHTFKCKPMREFVEEWSHGFVLNLFAGPTKLNLNEIRNDQDITIEADYHMEALDFVKSWKGKKFDIIILDPPYSYRKSMEYYNGIRNSRFKKVKDAIPRILYNYGKVITFGYHSVSMGKTRGFEPIYVAVFSHGGAVHDTIATVEMRIKYAIL